MNSLQGPVLPPLRGSQGFCPLPTAHAVGYDLTPAARALDGWNVGWHRPRLLEVCASPKGLGGLAVHFNRSMRSLENSLRPMSLRGGMLCTKKVPTGEIADLQYQRCGPARGYETSAYGGGGVRLPRGREQCPHIE